MLAGAAGLGILAALRLWPSETEVQPHAHPDLAPGHPYLESTVPEEPMCMPS